MQIKNHTLTHNMVQETLGMQQDPLCAMLDTKQKHKGGWEDRHPCRKLEQTKVLGLILIWQIAYHQIKPVSSNLS